MTIILRLRVTTNHSLVHPLIFRLRLFLPDIGLPFLLPIRLHIRPITVPGRCHGIPSIQSSTFHRHHHSHLHTALNSTQVKPGVRQISGSTLLTITTPTSRLRPLLPREPPGISIGQRKFLIVRSYSSAMLVSTWTNG